VFAGEPVAFDGTASSDTDGSIASYAWQWGDATPDATSAKPTHVFAAPGTYQVALFVLDDNTQSGAAIHNVTVVPLVVPRVKRASLTHKRFRVGSRPTAVIARAPRGTSFRFTLRAPAKLTIDITRGAKKVGRLTRKHPPNGRETIPFSGRIGHRALKPGAYKATLRARNAKGKAKPVTVRFVVVR
jgi:PKD repeat protein